MTSTNAVDVLHPDWVAALERTGGNGPTGLILTRQGVPILPGTSAEGVARGGYVLKEADGAAPDVIIIGTGSGNSIPSPEFDDQKIAIIEKGTFGGTCLNVGCIPTKMYVYAADIAVAAREAGEVKALMRAEDDAHHAKRHYEWMVKHYDKMARDAAEVMRRVRAGEDMKIPPLGGTTTHLHFD